MSISHITMPLKRGDIAFKIDLGDSEQAANIKWYLERDSFPEAELIQLLVRAVYPGDYVVDAGACTGFFTLMMGALGGVVLAIEPGANNLPELYQNVGINNFAIHVQPVALGDRIEDRDFLLIDDGGANSFTQPLDRHEGKKARVSVVTLQQLVQNDPKLIKLDIEGSEFDVLAAWLKGPRRCPYIACEYNLPALDRAGHTGDELRALLFEHGYETWVLFADGMMPMMVPENVSINTTKQNVDILFATAVDVGRLWPELLV